MWPYLRGMPLFLATALAMALMRRLSSPAANKAGRWAGEILYHLLPAVRRHWLQRLQAQGFGARSTRILHRKFQNEGLSLAELARIPSLSANSFEIQGEAHLCDALAQQKGLILVSVHAGNWEIAGIGMALHGYPTTALNWPARNVYLEQMQQRWRLAYGIESVHPGKDAAQVLLRTLRQKRLVFVMLDVESTQNRIPVRFLGQPAHFSPLPLILSLRTGAPIVPAVTRRIQDNRCMIKLYSVFHPRGRAYLAQDTRLLAQLFTQVVLECPEQYDWLIEGQRLSKTKASP